MVGSLILKKVIEKTREWRGENKRQKQSHRHCFLYASLEEGWLPWAPFPFVDEGERTTVKGNNLIEKSK